jgi:hypothetical protein
MGSSDPANDDTPGYAFEDFERLDRIGAGGTADVYRARIDDEGGTRDVALKTPQLDASETVEASFFESFVDEASIWERIDDHDHIVDVYDWGAEPVPWIAMEYMDAGHLGDRAAGLSRNERVAVFRDVCDAVFHAHRHGITHGDLKPENVLLTRSDGGDLVAKVGDWGLAEALLDRSRSPEGLTVAYSAPEQLDSDAYGPVDDRTDVYQLSAVAYELFTGAPPFEVGGTGELVHRILNDAPTPPSERADVPAALDDAIRRGLETDRADRYETVLYLRDAVVEALSGSAAEAATAPNPAATAPDPAPADRSGREATERDALQTATRTGADPGTATGTEADTDAGADTADADLDTDVDANTLDRTDGTEGLGSRLHRPVESLNEGRGLVGSVRFALHYPRSAGRRTLYNWWIAALASILFLPAPLMIGYLVESIQSAAETRAPTFRLRDGAWLRHYRRGLVGAGLAFGPFVLYAAVSTPAGANAETTTAEGLLALLTVVSWAFLPGLLSTYATGGLSALATRAHWRRYATVEYLGTCVGLVAVGLLAYLVTVGLAVTIVGIAVAYFYLMVAVGGFLGRRA